MNAGAAAGLNGRGGLTVVNGGDALSISVSNTGAAMTEADGIQAPCRRGAGIGLRLVHDIVAGLFGTMRHDDAGDQTVIRVDLPAQGGTHA